MRRTLAVLAVLALTCIARATDTPKDGMYMGVFTNTTPPEGFAFAIVNGPPKMLFDGVAATGYVEDPETGVYVASNGDSWWMADGIAHFTHPLPYPAMGPFASKDGPYSRAE